MGLIWFLISREAFTRTRQLTPEAKGGFTMKKVKRSILACTIGVLAVCGMTTGRTNRVAADASIKTQQGVVIRSASLTTNKTIKVPQKETKAKSSSKVLSRGGTTEVSARANNVVDYALNYVGYPYVWGAAGPRAFDCSGFVMYVYGKYGVGLPHQSGSQFGCGSSVAKSALSPGDLVFFNTYGSISHVGIYIGGGRFVHAASSKTGVIVSDLTEGYYAARYAGARRVK